MKNLIQKQITEIVDNKLVNSWFIHLIIGSMLFVLSILIMKYGLHIGRQVEGIPVTTARIFFQGLLAFIIILIGAGGAFLIGMGTLFVGMFGFRWQHKLHEYGLWPKAETVNDSDVGGIGAGDGFAC